MACSGNTGKPYFKVQAQFHINITHPHHDEHIRRSDVYPFMITCQNMHLKFS